MGGRTSRMGQSPSRDWVARNLRITDWHPVRLGPGLCAGVLVGYANFAFTYPSHLFAVFALPLRPNGRQKESSSPLLVHSCWHLHIHPYDGATGARYPSLTLKVAVVHTCNNQNSTMFNSFIDSSKYSVISTHHHLRPLNAFQMLQKHASIHQ